VLPERYHTRVWQTVAADALVQPLQRAFHAELCARHAPHTPIMARTRRAPLCARAYQVVVQWAEDGRPESDPEQ
jgi:hypothetical protein